MTEVLGGADLPVNQETWQKILLPPGNDDSTWELYHENSKIGRFDGGLSDEEVRRRSKEFHESLPFVGYPRHELPHHLTPLPQRLDETLVARASTRDLAPSVLTIETLATLLFYAYGDTRANKDGRYPRPFRVVPSGGALYPLEVFFHSACVDGADPGIYHYNPSSKEIRLVVRGDQTTAIGKSMIYSDITQNASVVVFITAIFERSVFKYGDRGYRFTLLEAGHVAQNLNLVATALGLGSVNIGGFYDREVDDLLGLDGIVHSTIYMLAIGARKGPNHGT